MIQSLTMASYQPGVYSQLLFMPLLILITPWHRSLVSARLPNVNSKMEMLRIPIIKFAA
jgi:hypothetical protein